MVSGVKTVLQTRLRVVFDCSATTLTGISFNDLQMVGPTIQNDLVSILLRFRIHAFVVSADIAKMYRQVLVNVNQRPLQRILWRYDSTKPIDVYELQTVTYGTSSAPFLAIRSLTQLGIDCENECPKVSQIIKNDFYVDDVLFGADSIQEASQLGVSLFNVLHQAGFELRKWHSNSIDIIENITSTKLSSQTEALESIDICPTETAKTLGLKWLCHDDKLIYKIGLTFKERRVSKRIILSGISQIFDPLGLVSPCVILVKVLMQKLWLEKLSWDESVPLSIHSTWLKFRDEISFLNSINIPRHVVCCHPISIELHCFSDASENAYGACIYVRSIDSDNKPHVYLICSKTSRSFKGCFCP